MSISDWIMWTCLLMVLIPGIIIIAKLLKEDEHE